MTAPVPDLALTPPLGARAHHGGMMTDELPKMPIGWGEPFAISYSDGEVEWSSRNRNGDLISLRGCEVTLYGMDRIALDDLLAVLSHLRALSARAPEQGGGNG